MEGKSRECVFESPHLAELTGGDPDTLSVWHLKSRRVLCCEASASGGSRGGRCSTVHNKPTRASGRSSSASRAMFTETCHTHTHTLMTSLALITRWTIHSIHCSGFCRVSQALIMKTKTVCNLHYQNNDASVITSRFTRLDAQEPPEIQTACADLQTNTRFPRLSHRAIHQQQTQKHMPIITAN